EIVEQTDDTPGRHDQGGWSQARYQRHIEKLVHEHLKEVGEHGYEQVRRLRGPKLIVVASEETRSEFESALSHDARKAIVGWTSADDHAPPAPVLDTFGARV